MEKFVKGKNINLRDLDISDAQFILDLRTNEDKSAYLNKTEYNIEKQTDYIKNYKKKSDEWYFVIESKEKEPLGTVRIYDIKDNSFSWGSWLVKDGAPTSTAIESALLIYEFAFFSLNFAASHFEVRRKNERVRAFHERFGAKIYEETDEDVFYKYTREDYLKIRPKYLKRFL